MKNIDKEIKSILLSENEINIERVRELLDINFRITYDMIFRVFEETIRSGSKHDIEVVMFNIECIIMSEECIDHHDYIKVCVKRSNHNVFENRKLFLPNFLKGIKYRLIDLNRRLRENERKNIKEATEKVAVIEEMDEDGLTTLSSLEEKYHVSLKIHDEVQKEVEGIQVDKSGRKRFDTNFVTIDEEGALCLDDAISLTRNKDGSYFYDIAITDIPSIVPYQSELYYAALDRVETLYLFDMVASLYLEIISNNLASLLPGVDRNVLVYRFLADPSLNIDPESLEIYKGIINVRSRLSYHDVNYWENMSPDTISMIEKMYDLSIKLRGLNPSKEKYRRLENLIRPDALYHHSLFVDKSLSANIVQEAMVLVNSSAAKYFFDRGLVYGYRNYGMPQNVFMDEEILELLNIYSGRTDSKEYKFLMDKIRQLYLSAYYSSTPEGHEGLGKKFYSHSTASARRFIDGYNQYLTHEQKFKGPVSDKRLLELEIETKKITEYINARKKEIEEFERNYNRLSSKGLILRR